MDSAFNLLDEKWISVMTMRGEADRVSLSEALLNAHQIRDLAGEMPTLDFVILRQMLALLYSVFSKVNAQGDEEDIEDQNQALDRWTDLWEGGAFPERQLNDYFEKWHDRFWLFDEERPFGQVNEAENGTKYTAAKLNGEMSESSNKLRLFPSRTGSGRQEMSYAEAANWLLYVNAFDDTSAKPKGKNLPSVGAGWLGKIGLIRAEGGNLFETLMLNLTLLRDGSELWGEGVPAWELDKPRAQERTEISVPENPASLYTLQSRRLLLSRANGVVNGFSLLGGDFFEREGAFAEQMTVWRREEGKKGAPDVFKPRRHDPSRQMWRDLASIVSQDAQSKHGRIPGVVRWVNEIRREMGSGCTVRFRIASVQYGDKDFFVTDVFEDSLAFHAELLDEKAECKTVALREIRRCDKIAYYVGELAVALELSAGGDTETINGSRDRARSMIYYRMDEPFRRWLSQLSDDIDALTALREAWKDEVVKLALDCGREMVEAMGSKIFSVRYIAEGQNSDKRKRYTAPEAFDIFQMRLNRVKNETMD